jgi:predicted Zn-dependent protease
MTRQQKPFLYAAILGGLAVAGVGAWWYAPTSSLRQAQNAVAAKDLAKAEALLRQLTQSEPSNRQAQFLYAQVLRRLERVKEAEASRRGATKASADGSRRIERLKQAEAALTQAVGQNPQDLDGRRELALLRAAQQFTPVVETHLLGVLERKPDDVEVLQALAEGYARSGRFVEAERLFTRWIEREPDHVDAWLSRGKTRLDAVKSFTARAGDAAADFREVLRRAPDHFEAHLYLAHSLLTDAHMAEAKEELLICRRLQPERIEPLIGLAACAVEDRAWDEAQALLDQVLALEPESVYALIMQGDLHLRQQRYDRAISVFKKVLVLEPSNTGARVKLAQVLRYTGKVEEAKQHERIYQDLRDKKAQESPGGQR